MDSATGEVVGEVTVHVDPAVEVEIDPLYIFAAAGSAWRGRAPAGARRDICYHNLNMSTSTEDLLVGATLRLREGRKYGLIGRNGVGKSTLLRHIAARRLPFFPKYVSTVLVQQEVPGSDSTCALEEVVSIDKRRAAMLDEEARLMSELERAPTEAASGLAESLAEIAMLLEQTESASAERRASEVLRRLGFDEELMRVPTSTLSGGWRMRVALAQVRCQSSE